MSAFEDVARSALAEITTPDTIGALTSETTGDDGVVTLSFVSTLSGYPGWHWSVSAAQVPGDEPTVLEAELMPGDGALLAPDWVPWVDRLEEYRVAQAAAGLVVEDDDEGADDLDDDDVDDDDLDDDAEDDDDLDDDADHDDDLGDDPDDGIDFESDDLGAAAPLGVDEQDEAEAESDEDRPEPAGAP